MPEVPEKKEDIIWIKHVCEVCEATTGYLEGHDPHCSRCAIDSAVDRQAKSHSESTEENIKEKYCLQDCINSDDPETLARVKSECADLGCNVCLSQTTQDDIEWPKHYNMGKIQPIDAIEAWNLDFRLANAVKYIARAGKKDPATTKKDLEKALWYIRRFIEKEL